MKRPTTKELNERIRECFGGLPAQSAAVRRCLKGGFVYYVRREAVPSGYKAAFGTVIIKTSEADKAREPFKTYGV